MQANSPYGTLAAAIRAHRAKAAPTTSPRSRAALRDYLQSQAPSDAATRAAHTRVANAAAYGNLIRERGTDANACTYTGAKRR